MNNKNIIADKYEAQGFVEALIAILIAGVATLVLMSIAVNTLTSVAQNEVSDQMTQEAVKGSELLNFVVDEYNYSDLPTHYFLPVQENATYRGSCYALDGDFGNISVTPAINGCRYQSTSSSKGINPNRCLRRVQDVKIDNSAFSIGDTSSTNVTSSDLFRIVCVHPDSTKNVLVAKVLTGNVSCRNLNQYVTETVGVHNDCNIYEYTSIYNIKNMN